jgi:GNAT superfamily N-acetyltransferase
LAFLDSHDETLQRPDAFWQLRTADAADGETAAQFVAVVDGEWVGSATVLVRATGQRDHLGRIMDDRQALVVGVYVAPAQRGSGAIDLLLATGAEWAAGLGLDRLELDVHRDNHRAQAAYRRAGFVPTGETLTSRIGPEIVMARPLP